VPLEGITPISATPVGGNAFAESNKMFDVTGVKFDRSQNALNAGDSVASVGDIHLVKLEDV
jgi:hypothetical protein